MPHGDDRIQLVKRGFFVFFRKQSLSFLHVLRCNLFKDTVLLSGSTPTAGKCYAVDENGLFAIKLKHPMNGGQQLCLDLPNEVWAFGGDPERDESLNTLQRHFLRKSGGVFRQKTVPFGLYRRFDVRSIGPHQGVHGK